MREEVVEDRKEGVIAMVNKRKASWKSMCCQDVDGLSLV